ncbi:MAG: sigma-70 family RNA polymerase sigma factor [Myxococcaceae bacterium]
MGDTVEGVYRRYFPLIREKCRSTLADSEEAQDVAQDTFIRLWKSGLPLADARKVSAWVYRTATHLAVDRLRRRKGPEQRIEADAPVAGGEARVEVREQLERLARQIPADELELAFLTRLDGLTQPECAEVLGVSERTVRRMLTKLDERVAALKELR